ncbi:MAG TPA: DUF6289 family protein [Thermoanaerobaculia bacterium]|jgi:hypothetical protein|nr:DUF6289 family protein [Thermoanaerobaculia bacterium]
MQRIPTPHRKALLATLVLAVAIFAATFVPASEAAPAGNCTYYSDAGHTTVVGQFGKDCCNNVVAWGVKTSFYSCSSACFICYPPPPQ